MSLYNKQAIHHAEAVHLLNNIFNWFYWLGPKDDRESWLRKIGETLDFDGDYIQAAVDRKLDDKGNIVS